MARAEYTPSYLSKIREQNPSIGTLQKYELPVISAADLLDTVRPPIAARGVLNNQTDLFAPVFFDANQRREMKADPQLLRMIGVASIAIMKAHLWWGNPAEIEQFGLTLEISKRLVENTEQRLNQGRPPHALAEFDTDKVHEILRRLRRREQLWAMSTASIAHYLPKDLEMAGKGIGPQSIASALREELTDAIERKHGPQAFHPLRHPSEVFKPKVSREPYISPQPKLHDSQPAAVERPDSPNDSELLAALAAQTTANIRLLPDTPQQPGPRAVDLNDQYKQARRIFNIAANDTLRAAGFKTGDIRNVFNVMNLLMKASNTVDFAYLRTELISLMHSLSTGLPAQSQRHHFRNILAFMDTMEISSDDANAAEKLKRGTELLRSLIQKYDQQEDISE